MNCLDQLEPRLSEIIRSDYIFKPNLTAEYNFTVPTNELLKDAGGFELPLDVDKLVFGGKKKNGFFIEAGAGGGRYGLYEYNKNFI